MHHVLLSMLASSFVHTLYARELVATWSIQNHCSRLKKNSEYPVDSDWVRLIANSMAGNLETQSFWGRPSARSQHVSDHTVGTLSCPVSLWMTCAV